MGVEGSIKIALDPSQGVTIVSTRPVHASRLLQGKRIDEALRMVPLLFSACGTAQACAAVRACEQAQGIAAMARTERVRDALVRLESMHEHLWRILLDWPTFLGECPQQEGMARMAALQRDGRLALLGGQDPFAPAAVSAREAALPFELGRAFAALLTQEVFGITPDSWLELDSEEMLAAWATGGTLGSPRLIAMVMERGWNDSGRCEVGALPTLESLSLHQAMQADGFIAKPEWDGACCETSCLTRTESGLLRTLRARYGNGLLVRLVARLTELARLSVGLLPQQSHTEPGTLERGTGVGRATAARGELFHSVRVQGSVVTDYRILAPTEWNFHPRGVLASGLVNLEGEEIEQQARLLINAIDPCVAYELRVG